MTSNAPGDNPFHSPTAEPADTKSGETKRRSIRQGLRRFLSLIVICTLGGVLVGLALWWVTTSAWSLFADLWWPSSGRSSGGDPIDSWANGIVRMLTMSSFAIFGGLVGLNVGLRLAFTDASTWKEYIAELRRFRREAGVTSSHGRRGIHWGSWSLLAGVAALYTLSAGFRARPLIPLTAAVPLTLVLLTAGGFAGYRGLRQPFRSMAIIGLILTAVGATAFVSAVWRIGLEGLMEAWL